MIALQEYEEDSTSEPDADLENQYYNAKTLKEANPREAIADFEKVLELETEKGEWGFKALKQMIKLLFHLVSCFNGAKVKVDISCALCRIIKWTFLLV